MSRFPDPARAVCIAAALAAGLGAASSLSADGIAPGAQYGLGRVAAPEEIAAWDIDVRPDGLGLPEGSGSVEDGDAIFAENCAVCHGDFGEGAGRWPVLAGGQGTLTNDRPNKTIGSYWPYLSTVYDYIHRAMPFGQARTLEPDDVYAITAYLLYMNDLVEDDFVLSKQNFTDIRLENEPSFFDDDRATTEIPAFSAAPCMTDCKEAVEITAHATVLDVTPGAAGGGDLEGGGVAPEAAAPAVAQAQATASTPAPAPVPTAAPEVAAPDPALIAAGEAVFRQCKACHAVGPDARNKVGPALTGILGHPAGQVPGFRYSAPLLSAARAGLVWTPETLSAFLADPKGYVQGTKMSFKGLARPEDIAAVIAYLESASP